MSLIWKKSYQDGQARQGVLSLTHGQVQTPLFMPVATIGALKGALEPFDVREMGFEMLLSNTYHLYLTPGHELVKRRGGLGQFINWSGPILTDSGGFQVFSLASQRKITDQGVTFASHRDGQKFLFTPEKVIDIQLALGVDIAMQLDECIPAKSSLKYAKDSMIRSLKWASNIKKHWQEKDPHQITKLFGIVQGVYHPDLRKHSAQELTALDLPGYAIGGVVETFDELDEILPMTLPFLPTEKPRYLMGIGTPENILLGIEQGIDMFDCVLPTRSGRHGKIITSQGDYNITNARYKDEDLPLDEQCSCRVCQHYNRSYIHHLFRVKEMLASRLASYHNLAFYSHFMKQARKHIELGTFSNYKKDFIDKRQRKGPK